MSKKTEAGTAVATQAPASPAKGKPTAEQLAKIHKGGSYRFNPATGEMERTRAPTAVASTRKAKSVAKGVK